MTRKVCQLFRATGAIIVLCCSSSLAFERGVARFDFRVVDDANQPVENARIRGGAWWPTDQKELFPALAKKDFDALTDTNGMASVEVIAYVDVRFDITKDCYYLHEGTYHFSLPGSDQMALSAGRWQPWPSQKVVTLNRVLNPVPMYAKRVKAPVPVLDAPAGYDLAKGDWVAPHGKGTVADFEVMASGQYVDTMNRDIQMTIRFTFPQAGLITNIVSVYSEKPIGSKLISAHDAPAEGYQPAYTYTQRMRPKLSDRINMTPRFGQIAYFRVRTAVDDKGQVKKAWYGKMYGDLYCAFDSDRRICVNFTYYLNPDGTRNVEFDPTRNLLTGLKSLEQVDRP